jgi:AcrR family transcriptional regulator
VSRDADGSGPDSDVATDQAAGASRTASQARILDAATVEFAEKGLAGARVAEIAAKAEVNKQLLYYYFGSKEGLYSAVLHSLVHISRDAVATLQDSELPSITEAFVTGMTPTELARRRVLRRLYMWEALERGADDIVQVDERTAGWSEVVALLRHAIERREIDDRFDPEMLMLAIDSVLNGPWMLPQNVRLITGLRPDDEEFRQRQAAFFRQWVAALAPREDV